jgi:hypothetical protein
VVTFLAQLSVKPIATGPGFIAKDEMLSLGWECSDEVIEVGLSRPDGAKVGDLSTVVLSDICDRDGVCMDIKTNVECARLVHG